MPCACLDCPAHPGTPCSIAGDFSATDRYCDACAPMWRCSCVLSSCRHHRDAPQCNKHVLWGERRLVWPGMAKNICLKCAAQYCSCTSSTCAAHPGSSCARCRQGGPLCHACSRGGVDVCLCGGCASCGHAACQNLARLAYRSGGKNALCLPCAEHVLLALAAQVLRYLEH